MMRERNQGRTQEQAAAKANPSTGSGQALKSRKTVAKYEQLGQLPSELKQPRRYRTRTDPFAEDWPELEQLLQGAPELQAKTLFEWLCERQPGKYQASQLRTLQRRVADWRVLHQDQVATLEQVHRPGEALQTDNTSAATYQLSGATGSRRAFNPGYLALLNHFGLKPRTIHLGYPQQNGDIEASNGGLKQALAQHLLLRGSRHFETLADYEAFVGQVMTKRNQRRQQRLQEELAVMKPLTASPLWPYQEVRVKVNRGSLIRVQHNVYSVPTHLIGQQVTVRIYEWQLEVYYRSIQVAWMPRLVGQKKQQINYRHLIDSLLRKPGGFRRYRYREALFPSLVFRQAWDQLQQWYSPRKADLVYLRVLRLAARYLECEVAEALSLLLARTSQWDETDVEQLLQPQKSIAIPTLTPAVVNLAQYDRLLQEVSCDPA